MSTVVCDLASIRQSGKYGYVYTLSAEELAYGIKAGTAMEMESRAADRKNRYGCNFSPQESLHKAINAVCSELGFSHLCKAVYDWPVCRFSLPDAMANVQIKTVEEERRNLLVRPGQLTEWCFYVLAVGCVTATAATYWYPGWLHGTEIAKRPLSNMGNDERPEAWLVNQRELHDLSMLEIVRRDKNDPVWTPGDSVSRTDVCAS